MILEMQFSNVSERAHAIEKAVSRDGEVLLVERSNERAASRLKRSAWRDCEFDGERGSRCDLSVVTWIPNRKFAALRSEPLSHLPNQSSEPTPTSVTICAEPQIAPAAVAAHL